MDPLAAAAVYNTPVEFSVNVELSIFTDGGKVVVVDDTVVVEVVVVLVVVILSSSQETVLTSKFGRLRMFHL